MSEEVLGQELPLDEESLAGLVRDGLFMRRGAYVRRDVRHGTAYVRQGAELPAGCDAVVSIGAFDGLHAGHRALIAAARREADERGLPCVVVTFDPDPDVLLVGEEPSTRLLATADRVRAIESLGADAVVVLRFDEELEQTGYQDFVTQVLGGVVRPASIHVGTNFRVGAGGRGDVRALAAFCDGLGCAVHGHDLVTRGGSPVSSTRIRSLLHKGAVEDAAGHLERLHFVRGTVEHGRGEGTAFGFPTANVRTSPVDCMPRAGVYACVVCDGRTAWPAAVNVGKPPTFSAPEDNFLEANLVGFAGDLYGSEVSVLFARWLRASRPFDSTEELERVVLGNIDWVRTNLGSCGVGVDA